MVSPSGVLTCVGIPGVCAWPGDLTTTEARDVRDARSGDGALLAVTGYLTILTVDPDCAGAADTDRHDLSFCDRTAVISDVRASPLGSDGGRRRNLGPHLHPRLSPGLATPSAIAMDDPATSRPIPVVLIGRFVSTTPASCTAGRECSHDFVVEHVAWVAGRWQPGTSALDPSLVPGVVGTAPGTTTLTRRERRVAVAQAVSGAGPTLSEAKVSTSTLARIDPAAAAGLEGDPTGPLWYIRAMVPRRRGRSIAG
jgi:hypothetical protein